MFWARLIKNCQWDNVEWPANVPIFGTKQSKKLQKESTTEVITNPAMAITKHFQSPPLANKTKYRPIQS